MINDETELAALEEHILACEPCAERADETQNYVDAVRVAALMLPLRVDHSAPTSATTIRS